MAVVILGEALAGIGEGGTAAVEAVGVVEGGLSNGQIYYITVFLFEKGGSHLVAMIADPFWDRDGGDGQAECCAGSG